MNDRCCFFKLIIEEMYAEYLHLNKKSKFFKKPLFYSIFL